MLPQQFSNETYWKEIHPQPPAYWEESLKRITQRHFQQSMFWERAELGRNIVFYNQEWVIKLTPPGWVEDVPREMAALRAVAGRLPVDTPELIYTGALDAWQYIIERSLPGANLRDFWSGMPPDQKDRIAYQHGELYAALRGIKITEPADQRALVFDWEEMLSYQRSVCAQEMRKAGVPPVLVDQAADYLESKNEMLRQADGNVLLHGDLTHLNFLVETDGDGWKISGLIDWGDAKLGPPRHEFISPGVHMYLGDRRSLEYFTLACGEPLEDDRRRDELMARAMLYYAEDFAYMMDRLPEIKTCPDWDCVAKLMW